jgi:hypothetical protein
VGMKTGDDLLNLLVNELKALVVVQLGMELQNVHFNQSQFLAFHHDQPIAHYKRTWIDSQNNF